MLSGRRLAPMTATEPAFTKRSIDRAAARWSRCSMTPIAVSVGSMENSRAITPWSYSLATR